MKTATRNLRRSALTLVALSTTLVASLAFAHGGPGRGQGQGMNATPATQGRIVERFQTADADKDGFVSLAEAEKSLPQMALRFAALDTNQDGKLSTEELQNMRNTARGSMRPTNMGVGMQSGMQGRGGMRGNGGGQMRTSNAGAGCTLADADKDGFVTREEALNRGPRFQQRFESVDTNKDGKLSTEELSAACPALKS